MAGGEAVVLFLFWLVADPFLIFVGVVYENGSRVFGVLGVLGVVGVLGVGGGELEF